MVLSDSSHTDIKVDLYNKQDSSIDTAYRKSLNKRRGLE